MRSKFVFYILILCVLFSDSANASAGYYPLKLGEVVEISSCIPKNLKPPIDLQVQGPKTSGKKVVVETVKKFVTRPGNCAKGEVELFFDWQSNREGSYTLYLYSPLSKKTFYPWPDGVDIVANPTKNNLLRGLLIDLMPEASQNNGNFCQSVLGQGWYCTIELRVINKGTRPWSGSLGANLITTNGKINIATSSPTVGYYSGRFFDIVNPNDKYRWNTYFKVAAGQRFQTLAITEAGQVILTIPVCLGTTIQDELGCTPR